MYTCSQEVEEWSEAGGIHSGAGLPGEWLELGPFYCQKHLDLDQLIWMQCDFSPRRGRICQPLLPPPPLNHMFIYPFDPWCKLIGFILKKGLKLSFQNLRVTLDIHLKW